MTVTPRKMSTVLGPLDQPKPEPTVWIDGTVERDPWPPPALSLLLFLVTETRPPATLQPVLVGVGLSPGLTVTGGEVQGGDWDLQTRKS